MYGKVNIVFFFKLCKTRSKVEDVINNKGIYIYCMIERVIILFFLKSRLALWKKGVKIIFSCD